MIWHSHWEECSLHQDTETVTQVSNFSSSWWGQEKKTLFWLFSGFHEKILGPFCTYCMPIDHGHAFLDAHTGASAIRWLAYHCRLERHFQHFDFSVAPRQGGEWAALSCMSLRVPEKQTVQKHQGFIVCPLVVLCEVNQAQLLSTCLMHLMWNGTRVSTDGALQPCHPAVGVTAIYTAIREGLACPSWFTKPAHANLSPFFSQLLPISNVILHQHKVQSFW